MFIFRVWLPSGTGSTSGQESAWRILRRCVVPVVSAHLYWPAPGTQPHPDAWGGSVPAECQAEDSTDGGEYCRLFPGMISTLNHICVNILLRKFYSEKWKDIYRKPLYIHYLVSTINFLLHLLYLYICPSVHPLSILFFCTFQRNGGYLYNLHNML